MRLLSHTEFMGQPVGLVLAPEDLEPGVHHGNLVRQETDRVSPGRWLVYRLWEIDGREVLALDAVEGERPEEIRRSSRFPTHTVSVKRREQAGGVEALEIVAAEDIKEKIERVLLSVEEPREKLREAWAGLRRQGFSTAAPAG